MNSDDWVFLDEMGVLLETVRRYGRNLPGQPVIGRASHGRIQRTTVVGALNQSGLGALMTLEGGMTGDAFRRYLEQVLIPSLRPGQTVVLDNLSAHKVKGVRSLIEAAGCHLLYLPPYSPDFNPIEYAWSLIKRHIQGTRSASPCEFDALLVHEASRITAATATAWITHCGYRLRSKI